MTLLLSNGNITIDFNQDYLERFYDNRYNTAYDNDINIRKKHSTYSIDVNRNINDMILYNFLYQRMNELGYQNNINEFIYFKIEGNLILKFYSKYGTIILNEKSDVYDITDDILYIKQIDFVFDKKEPFNSYNNKIKINHNILLFLFIIFLIILFINKNKLIEYFSK